MISRTVGESIPPNTKHAVSVCLPTWEATVGYEEGESDIINSLTTGYPRFFIHKSIKKLCEVLCAKYSMENETCLCFPSYKIANRCREFIKVKTGLSTKVRILQLCTPKPMNQEEKLWRRECKITVVFVDQEIFPVMKQYWQHTGEIVSSRMAEYILHELEVKESLKSTGLYLTSLQQQQATSNNPFAKPNQEASPQRQDVPSMNASSMPQQQQQQQPQQEEPLTQTRTGNQSMTDKYSKLNELLGTGTGIDTFGNFGDTRVPAQHTKTGTFINSQGTGYRQVSNDPKHNPFLNSQYTGLPSTNVVPTQTGYGFGNQQQQQSQTNGSNSQGYALIDL